MYVHQKILLNKTAVNFNALSEVTVFCPDQVVLVHVGHSRSPFDHAPNSSHVKNSIDVKIFHQSLLSHISQVEGSSVMLNHVQ